MLLSNWHFFLFKPYSDKDSNFLPRPKFPLNFEEGLTQSSDPGLQNEKGFSEAGGGALEPLGQWLPEWLEVGNQITDLNNWVDNATW